MPLEKMWDVSDFLVARELRVSRNTTFLGHPNLSWDEYGELVELSASEISRALTAVGRLRQYDLLELCEELWRLDDFHACPEDPEELGELFRDIEQFIRATSTYDGRIIATVT